MKLRKHYIQILGVFFIAYYSNLFEPSPISIPLEYVTGLYPILSIVLASFSPILLSRPNNPLEEIYRKLATSIIKLNLLILSILVILHILSVFISRGYLIYAFITLSMTIVMDIIMYFILIPYWLDAEIYIYKMGRKIRISD